MYLPELTSDERIVRNSEIVSIRLSFCTYVSPFIKANKTPAIRCKRDAKAGRYGSKKWPRRNVHQNGNVPQLQAINAPRRHQRTQLTAQNWTNRRHFRKHTRLRRHHYHYREGGGRGTPYLAFIASLNGPAIRVSRRSCRVSFPLLPRLIYEHLGDARRFIARGNSPLECNKNVVSPPSRPLGCPHLSPGSLRGSFAPWKDGEPPMLVPSNVFFFFLLLLLLLLLLFLPLFKSTVNFALSNPRRIILLVAGARYWRDSSLRRMKERTVLVRGQFSSRRVLCAPRNIVLHPGDATSPGKKGSLFLREPRTVFSFGEMKAGRRSVGRHTLLLIASEKLNRLQKDFGICHRDARFQTFRTLRSDMAIRWIYRRARALRRPLLVLWCPSLA